MRTKAWSKKKYSSCSASCYFFLMMSTIRGQADVQWTNLNLSWERDRLCAGKYSYLLGIVLFYSASRLSSCDLNDNQWTAVLANIIPKDKNMLLRFLQKDVFDPSVEINGTNIWLSDKAWSKKKYSSCSASCYFFFDDADLHLTNLTLY